MFVATRRSARAAATEIGGAIAASAAAIAFIRPQGNFPLVDDPLYGLPALEFARTGQFHLTLAPASVRAQVVWGALFVRLFGSTFDALRIASLVSTAIAIAMFNLILARTTAPRAARIFATVAFAFHPLLFWSSCTFMTEAHFVCASSIAVYFYLRGLQEDRAGDLLLGCAGVALSWWVRQTGIMTAVAPLAMLVLFRERLAPRWKRHVAICTIPIVVFAVIYKLRPSWLMGSAMEFYGLMKMWHEGTFRLPQQIALVFHYTFLTTLNSAVFLAPLVALLVPALRRRFERRELIGVAVAVLLVAIGIRELFAERFPMPFYDTTPCCELLYGNILSNLGLGPPTMPGVFGGEHGYPFALSYGGRVVFTLLAGALAAVLAATMFLFTRNAMRAPREQVPLLFGVAFTIAHIAGLCISGAYFDRYALSSAWPLAISTIAAVDWRGARRWIAIAALVVVALFDTFSVDEYFAWNRARWAAWNDLRAAGAKITDIDGGAEPFGMYELAYVTDIHQRRRMAYGPGPRPYSISFYVLPEHRVVRAYPFRGWLGLHRGVIYSLAKLR